MRNHAHHLWAADLFTRATLTLKRCTCSCGTADCRRELVHTNVTANPRAVHRHAGSVTSRERVVERVIGTVLDELHLTSLLTEFVRY